jgi:hypothetical protein
MDINSPTYHATIAQLNGAVEFFLKTGFLMLEDPEIDKAVSWPQRHREWVKNAPPLPQPQMRKLIRKIAKELKRPLVFAHKAYYPNHDGVITVQLKRIKRHAPLMSPFFLLNSYEGKSWEFDKLTPGNIFAFRWKAAPANWELVFIGTEGREKFNEWMEFIQNSPECRKALKLPEANNVIPLAA